LRGVDIRRLWSPGLTRRLPILLILAGGTVTGLWLGDDYGLSWDEHRNAVVGEEALRAYVGEGNYFSLRYIADHGPAYFMLFSASSRLIHSIAPETPLHFGRHLTNYAVFLVGVLFLHRLCLRFMSPGSALMATALFATQPLLLGHGFVSQKDIPFMTFFLVTVVTGIEAADRGRDRIKQGPSESLQNAASSDLGFRSSLALQWRALNTPTKVVLVSAVTFGLALLIDLFLVGTLRRIGASTVAAAYDGKAPMLAQWIFSRVATDAHKTTAEAYLAKYLSLFANLRLGISIVVAFIGLAGVGRALPSVADRLGISRTAIGDAGLLASAVMFGLTISIRQLGAFAGVLVTLFLLTRLGTRMIFPIFVYWVIAGLAAYASWPYLWPDPLGRFTGSVVHAANFPVHATMFRGVDLGSNKLPWDYFPTMTSLQLTEPAVLLILLGSGVTVWRLSRGRRNSYLVPVLLPWMSVPVLALVTHALPAYGIRHLLFLFPPLFVLAGIGWEVVAAALHRPWLRAILSLLVLTPGIVGIAYMHPYEYAYYNSLAGGASGAYDYYELDRGCLSFREATEVVNQLAEPNAVVGIPTQTNQVEPFLRPDLKLVSEIAEVESADLVISCLWSSQGDWHTRDFEQVYAVHRGDAVFAEVWRRRQ